MKFRKKPVVIEAFRYNLDPRPDWFQDRVTDNTITTWPDECHIKTLEGLMSGMLGDWIIQGVKGEIYPCKPDIFAATYEAVESRQVTCHYDGKIEHKPTDILPLKQQVSSDEHSPKCYRSALGNQWTCDETCQSSKDGAK